MYKKTLLSMAVASTLTLTGCLDSGSSGVNGDPDYKITSPNSDGIVSVVFNPVTSELPIPNDLIIDQDQKDGTYGIDPDPTNPVITALNEMSGASTIAPIDIELSGFINPDTVNGTEVIFAADGVTPIPNPAQTVFLLELEYASGDPLQGLINQEVPTVWNALRFGAASFDPLNPTPEAGAAATVYGDGDAVQGALDAGADLAALATTPAYEAVVKELSGTSYIRINPIKPLNPRKRYIVVVTNGVLDTDGNPVSQSTTYQSLTNDNIPIGSSSLLPVEAIMNGLWEPSAIGYFDAVANLTRPDAPLTEDNISMSISLTTSVDMAVSYYIAEPAFWMTDRLEDSVKVGAAVASGATTFADTYQAVQTAYLTWLPSDLDEDLQPCDAAGTGLPTPAEQAEARFNCAGTALIGSLEAQGIKFPTPAATTITFDPTTIRDAAAKSALISPLGVDAGLVNVVEGTMTVPYYLGTPNGEDGSALVTDNWVADNVLAAQLKAALGFPLAQADPSVSTAVNYLFPFPKKTVDQTIPVLAMYPQSASGLANLTPVIYQHGITTDRTAAFAYGTSMVAGALPASTNIAVIAIDQPLHGIAPVSTDEQLDLAATLLESGLGLSEEEAEATAPAVVNGTFSTGVLQQIDVPCTAITVDYNDPADVATKKGQVAIGQVCDPEVPGSSESMSAALVLESTVANGGSQIPGFAPTADTTNERHFSFSADENNQPAPMNYDNDDAFGASGSLFINLGNFLASRDNLRQQVNDLLTLRLSLGSIDFDGNGTGVDASNTFFIGHSLGTVNGIPFVAVANDTSTTADDIAAANMLTPGGGLVRLVENSPSLAPQILGGIAAATGLTQGDADLESLFNVLQQTVDASDAVNFITPFSADEDDYTILLSEVIGDTTIPNSAYPEPNLPNASASPTAGTEPLITFSMATNLLDAPTFPTPLGDANALTQNAVRYTAGFHGTPVYPANGTTEEEISGEQAVFAEMVGQSTTMVILGGTGVVVGNPDVIQE